MQADIELHEIITRAARNPAAGAFYGQHQHAEPRQPPQDHTHDRRHQDGRSKITARSSPPSRRAIRPATSAAMLHHLEQVEQKYRDLIAADQDLSLTRAANSSPQERMCETC